MSIQQDVLDQARSRIGYYAPDDPQPGSEAGRWCAQQTGQAWLAGPSVSIWWCMMFVSMCLGKVGQAGAIGGISQNTDVTIGRVRAGKGGSFVTVAQAQPGDVVIFRWNGASSGPTDHVGFVEKNLGNGWLQTIEGNTSGSDGPRQSNGNGVWRRQRSASFIACVIRPSYSGVSAPSEPEYPDASARILQDGLGGTLTTRKLQWGLGSTVDGEISGQYAADADAWPNLLTIEADDSDGGSSAILRLSQELAAAGWLTTEEPSRFLGPKVAEALQLALKAEGLYKGDIDKTVGPNTMWGLQFKLNTVTAAGGLHFKKKGA